jgi:hypothetical protein
MAVGDQTQKVPNLVTKTKTWFYMTHDLNTLIMLYDVKTSYMFFLHVPIDMPPVGLGNNIRGFPRASMTQNLHYSLVSSGVRSTKIIFFHFLR